jgi:hypothetical protein
MKMKEFFSAARIMGAAALTMGIVLAASVALTPSCSKDDGGSSGGGFNKIEATGIVNHDNIDIDKVKLVWQGSNGGSEIVIAEAAYSNSSFTMTLPTTLPSSVTLQVGMGEIPAGISVSNPNVKIASGFTFYGYKGSTRKAELSKFQDDNYEQGIVQVQVQLLYADAACTMKGEEVRDRYTIQYDMDIKKGWNWSYFYQGTPYKQTTYPPTSGYANVWSMWAYND